MGVHGLWRLIEPSGKPVPVESLENKVLAVDVSIWLHQAIKGFQDAKGAPALNAHLLLIFHRICKLLYFKVKPIFVFDGGVPALKRQTIAKRRQLKNKNISEAEKIHKQLLDTLIKHSAVNKVLGEKALEAISSLAPPKVPKSRETDDDLFKLPEKNDSTASSSEDEDDSQSPTKNWNLHNIDTKSDYFKSLPADVRHEILTDLKETRKQSSWGRLHELPKKSDDFSGFQMKRLLKRYEVQSALEEAAKEIGGHSLSLAELEDILKDQGIISDHLVKGRIASDENKRYLYVRDIKQALEQARRKKEKEVANTKETPKTERNSELSEEKISESKTITNKGDLEFNKDIQEAIALSLQDQPSSSGISSKKKLSELSFLENFKDEDFESNESDDDKVSSTIKTSKLKSAQNYMMEYSGLTPSEIERIISKNESEKSQIKQEFQNFEVSESNEEKIENRSSSKILNEMDQDKKSIDEDYKLEKNTRENEEIVSKNEYDKSDSLNAETLVKTERSSRESPVSEKEVTFMDVTTNSASSDDDFEEVSSTTIETKNIMEIEIKTEKFNEEDDLFADIFTETTSLQPCEKKEDIKEEKTELEDSETEKVNEKDDLFADIFTETTSIREKKDDIGKEETKLNDSPEKTQLIERKGKIIEESTEIKRNEDKNDQSQELKQKTEEQIVEKAKTKITENDLVKMRDDLDKEQSELRSEQGLRERLGTNITDQMYKEAQELLELFGLPYVIAPMEAEAQCAYLELISLTDGTITDDSDIWLFGGKTVYKNFFNQSKHVLEYRADDIKHHFKLTREQMILLALLVGSDYTVGLQGVGPVTALEILAAFPPSNISTFTLSHNQLLMGLKEFKLWFVNGKTGVKGKHTLRNKLKNIAFTDNFPSIQVVDAYLNPTVDKSEENFTWSKPDIVSLIDFGRSKFGWSKTRTEDILKPVLKKMKETKYQSTLLNYFQIKHNLSAEEAQNLMSERVKLAVKRIGQDPEIEDEDEKESDKNKKKSKPRKRKKDGGSKTDKTDPEKLLSGDEFARSDEIEALLNSLEEDSSKELPGKSKQRRKKHNKLPKNNIDEDKNITDKDKNFENKETNSLQTMDNSAVESTNAKIETKQSDKPNLKQRKRPHKKLSDKTTNIRESGEHKEGNNPTTSKTSKTKLVDDEMSEFSSPPKKLKKSNVKTTIDQKSDKSNIDEASIKDLDEELKLLQATEALSKKKVEEIKASAEKQIEQEINKKKLILRKLHHKEIIPQKERDKRNLMRTKMKAIEVFRKSKIDPSTKKGDRRKVQTPKEDAGLSEESSDSDL